MKRKTILSILTLGVIVLFASTDVQAQSPNVTRINVPFAFTVGEQLLPNGDYLIHRLSHHAPNVLRIMSKDGELEASIHNTMPVYENQNPGPGRLVFNKYGNELFLSQLWLTGSTTGREFRVSDAEREVAANTARVRTAIVLGQ